MDKHTILNMKAGEIDPYIAEFVMGKPKPEFDGNFESIYDLWGGAWSVCIDGFERGEYRPLPFSSDLETSDLVVTRMICLGYYVTIRYEGALWRCTFKRWERHNDVNYEATAKTQPLAICRAALLTREI